MSIRRGEDWGSTGPLPSDGRVVDSDAGARAAVTAAARVGTEPPPLGLTGGDLCRTLGGRGDEQRFGRDDAARMVCDVGVALVDGRLHRFVAHLVAWRSWWRGPVLAVMNAGHLGEWDVAPRAHPGDGRLDVLEADLAVTERVKARRRLPSGTHVPHPGISYRQVEAAEFEFDRPTPVYLDGELVGTASTLSVRVEPASLLVVV